MKLQKCYLLIFASIFLASCGGGSGGSTTSSNGSSISISSTNSTGVIGFWDQQSWDNFDWQ